MSKAYSKDLRVRVLAAVDQGMPAREAARVFSVSPAAAIKWVQLWRLSGIAEASPVRGHRKLPLDLHANWLLDLIAKQPDLTLAEIKSLLLEREVSSCENSIWRFFKRHGISSQKTLHASEQDRADVAKARTEWKDMQPALDPEKLVFLDETGTATNMVRLRGRCERGKRLLGKAPHGHWKTTTFVAGLRCDAITAPFVIDCPMTREEVARFVRRDSL